MPITASHLGAGLHAAGLSAAISSAAAAGLVGENVPFLIVHLTFYHNSPETNKIITQNNLYDLFTADIKRNNDHFCFIFQVQDSLDQEEARWRDHVLVPEDVQGIK